MKQIDSFKIGVLLGTIAREIERRQRGGKRDKKIANILEEIEDVMWGSEVYYKNYHKDNENGK